MEHLISALEKLSADNPLEPTLPVVVDGEYAPRIVRVPWSTALVMNAPPPRVIVRPLLKGESKLSYQSAANAGKPPAMHDRNVYKKSYSWVLAHWLHDGSDLYQRVLARYPHLQSAYDEYLQILGVDSLHINHNVYATLASLSVDIELARSALLVVLSALTTYSSTVQELLLPEECHLADEFATARCEAAYNALTQHPSTPLIIGTSPTVAPQEAYPDKVEWFSAALRWAVELDAYDEVGAEVDSGSRALYSPAHLNNPRYHYSAQAWLMQSTTGSMLRRIASLCAPLGTYPPMLEQIAHVNGFDAFFDALMAEDYDAAIAVIHAGGVLPTLSERWAINAVAALSTAIDTTYEQPLSKREVQTVMLGHTKWHKRVREAAHEAGAPINGKELRQWFTTHTLSNFLRWE